MRVAMRAILPVIFLAAVTAHAQNADLSGKWQVSITHHGQPEYAKLTLKAAGAGWAGEMFGRPFTVTPLGAAIEVRCQAKDAKEKDCGVLTGRLSEGVMNASGKIFDEEATWTAQRAPTLEREARRYEFVPKTYHNHFSGLIEPALRIKPGDTVHTTTVDAGGDDYIMVLGIGNSLEDALRSATTGMSKWLANTYKLNGAEIAMVLGSSMRYDIAEVVDPRVHVVAKVSKSALKPIEPSK